jgi:NAD(P)-dependent dehydrogenase (short-subunit alcohol dehydrogenase family)
MTDMHHRYPLSKLILFYAVREYTILNPIPSTGVVVNYVNPGLCETDLTRHVEEHVRNHIQTMRDAIGRTAEEGSRTLLHGAFAGDDSHGKYLSESVPKE